MCQPTSKVVVNNGTELRLIHLLLSPALYSAGSPCVAKTALTHRGRDTRLLGGLCRLALGHWQWILWVGVVAPPMDQTCSCTSHRFLSGWDLVNLGMGSMPWAPRHVPWVIPKQVLLSGRVVLRRVVSILRYSVTLKY